MESLDLRKKNQKNDRFKSHFVSWIATSLY